MTVLVTLTTDNESRESASVYYATQLAVEAAESDRADVARVVAEHYAPHVRARAAASTVLTSPPSADGLADLLAGLVSGGSGPGDGEDVVLDGTRTGADEAHEDVDALVRALAAAGYPAAVVSPIVVTLAHPG